MNYGFVIDNRSCIGCHACSTACKSENEVPLGVYRTWVKSVETGSHPDTRRSFQVTRCNHCANPPCVRICPTGAMYRRPDGIVEFDGDSCIGCKACLQACPYDAIYIDPETLTAAKCHYCSHRVEVGLEPACVVVCPTHAILAGDMDDPRSEISRVLAKEKVLVRKPEQGTSPKLFYIEGSPANLVPTAAEQRPDSFMAAEVIEPRAGGCGGGSTEDPVGAFVRSANPVEPGTGPGQPLAGQMLQVAYNAQHAIPWHWPVPAYLVTKGIGAGLFLLLAAAFGLGAVPFHPATAVAGGAIVVAMMLATTALLVFDLEHPERFLYILLRLQWRSWLTRGAVVLIGFTTLASLWTGAEAGAHFGWIPAGPVAAARPVLLLAGAPLALLAAVYTAFLFAQAEGRDLWQGRLLAMEFAVRAVVLGAAAILVAAPLLGSPEAIRDLAALTLVCGLFLDLLLLGAEFRGPHGTEEAAAAARAMTRGRWRRHFWWGGIALGHALPLALAATGHPLALAAAGLAVAAGLFLHEQAFVMAPQEVPNS